MNEIKILEKILPGLLQGADIALGPGDDCAAIDIGLERLLLAAVDQVIGEIHYVRQDTTPQQIGAKLLKRNLSDIAAMGGKPAWALLALASNNPDESWYTDFFAGLQSEAERWNISICGGDLGCLPQGKTQEVASLTILGTVAREHICLRSSARPEDLIYVTGSFGNSFMSGHHLNFLPRLAEGEFLANEFTAAMIDISDGLLLDAMRMAKASLVGFELEPELIPLRTGASVETALSDGEDYELLFTVSADKAERLEKEWPFTTGLTRIGKVTSTHPGIIFDYKGNDLTLKVKKGYEHSS
ncbi:MAG: thiamine-phosphate kinase [Victivallaceae bacterium]